jgi:RNA polymerase sigma-70 factor (ECF subfamily)
MLTGAWPFPRLRDFFYVLWWAMNARVIRRTNPSAGTATRTTEALRELIGHHHRRLYRTARAILHDDAEAQDAVQQACLQAYRALATFRGESELSSWLVRITANEALMRRRSRARAAAKTPMDAGN